MKTILTLAFQFWDRNGMYPVRAEFRNPFTGEEYKFEAGRVNLENISLWTKFLKESNIYQAEETPVSPGLIIAGYILYGSDSILELTLHEGRIHWVEIDLACYPRTELTGVPTCLSDVEFVIPSYHVI